MNAKQALARIGIYTLLLAVFFVLQTMLFPRIPILGVKPFLIPIAVVGIALFRGAVPGCFFGLAAGLLCDISFYETSVIFAFLFAAIGLAVGLLAESVLACGFPTFFICSLCALLLVAAVQLFGLLVYEGIPFASLSRVGLLQTGYSMLFVIPVYWTARGISHRMP